MKYHPVLYGDYKNWGDLESVIEDLPTTKSKGTAFEDFVYAYFLLRQEFYQIDKHWPYDDAPLELKRSLMMNIRDCGADGLIRFRDGKIAAYQAKFRTGREKPRYEELAKLWAEARSCDYQYTVANCYSLTDLAKKNKKHIQVLVDEFDHLDESFFDDLKALVNSKRQEKVYFQPEPYQVEMISAVRHGFENADRGKLIAACGSGKTLTALWITESLDAKDVLFIAPSIALIKQTLEAWVGQSKTGFDYICICSDRSVADGIDEGDLTISEIGVPVSTNIQEIVEKLQKPIGGRRYVFSTYQSLDLISKASVRVKLNFDLGIFDEAHRTAGTNGSALFSLGLNDSKIKIKKRLFMTATERLVRPWIVEKAYNSNRAVFSMDDEKSYGKTFYRYSFGEAINQGVISDYKIVIAGITSSEVFKWIKENRLLVDIDPNSAEYISGAENVFNQLMLIKAMKAFPINKCITFHATVKTAKDFLYGTSGCDFCLSTAIARLWPEVTDEEIFIDHVNGEMSSSDRHLRLQSFAKAKYGVISNARCLTEGVDVPIIDSVYFVDPKKSLIDIVQACGRALRKPRGPTPKVAYFVIPILIPEGDETNQEAFNKIDFEMVHNLIQSLRDQDKRMEQWIDKINLGIGRGSRNTRGLSGRSSPLIIDLPEEFSVEEFEASLYVRVAEVNGNPTSIFPKREPNRKNSRRSNVKRVFKTLGDYSVSAYKNSLVVPTLAKFDNDMQQLSHTQLKVGNNNVSHSERLGILRRNSDSSYSLSDLGKKLFYQEVTFDEIFKSQMLRFFTIIETDEGSVPLYSYRTVLSALKELAEISFYEYIFCIYTIKDPSQEVFNNALERIQYLRESFPNIEALNETNRAEILEHLNSKFDTDFRKNDIWKRNTTAANQWNYMRSHILLFEDLFEYDKTKRLLRLKAGKKTALSRLLQSTRAEVEGLSVRELLDRYHSGLIQVVKFTM